MPVSRSAKPDDLESFNTHPITPISIRHLRCKIQGAVGSKALFGLRSVQIASHLRRVICIPECIKPNRHPPGIWVFGPAYMLPPFIHCGVICARSLGRSPGVSRGFLCGFPSACSGWPKTSCKNTASLPGSMDLQSHKHLLRYKNDTFVDLLRHDWTVSYGIVGRIHIYLVEDSRIVSQCADHSK